MTYLSPQNIFDFIIGIGIIVYALAQWSNGKSTKKSNDEMTVLSTIQIKDSAIDTLQKEQILAKQQIVRQGERIAVLEAENIKLNAIVANRSPELENFMRQMTSSMLEVEKGIREILKAQTGNATINN